MNLKAQIKIVLSYEGNKSKWKNNHLSKEWRLANKISTIVMKEPLSRTKNCGCLDDLFIMLKSLSNEKINQKQKSMESKFELPKGKMVMSHYLGQPLTNANLTDEKALELLKKSPKMISLFSKHPDNWKELLNPGDSNNSGNNDDSGSDKQSTREDELLSTDVGVLRKIADDIAAENEINKASHRCGVQGLTKYILANE